MAIFADVNLETFAGTDIRVVLEMAIKIATVDGVHRVLIRHNGHRMNVCRGDKLVDLMTEYERRKRLDNMTPGDVTIVKL